MDPIASAAQEAGPLNAYEVPLAERRNRARMRRGAYARAWLIKSATVTGDLDLSEYDYDVIEHALVGRARSRMFEALNKSVAWSIALDRAQIEIGTRTFSA